MLGSAAGGESRGVRGLTVVVGLAASSGMYVLFIFLGYLCLRSLYKERR